MHSRRSTRVKKPVVPFEDQPLVATQPRPRSASNPSPTDLESISIEVTNRLTQLHLQDIQQDDQNDNLPQATSRALATWSKEDLKDLKSREILEMMSLPEDVVFEPFDPGHIHDSIPCIPDN
jgi:hypothetical protein